MQTRLIAGLTGALLLLVAPAWSAQNSQQTKMTTCNADAKTKGLTGDDRKAFMKTCLSADAPAPATGNSQQQKMKTCNADATTKGLNGDDRKAYMKTCLSSGN
jgi:hypothetical protein